MIAIFNQKYWLKRLIVRAIISTFLVIRLIGLENTRRDHIVCNSLYVSASRNDDMLKLTRMCELLNPTTVERAPPETSLKGNYKKVA